MAAEFGNSGCRRRPWRRRFPERPSFSLPAFTGVQPPYDTCIEELTVACECGPVFHCPLRSARGELSAHAGLRCVTVTCTRCIGDDGRFTGNAWQAYRTVELSGRAIRWLAQLPRVKADHASANVRWPMAAELVRYPTLYFPADPRCGDPGELTARESRLGRAQSTQSVADRLRATCRITGPPPPDLPSELHGYIGLWEVFARRSDSGVLVLLHHAQLRK